MIEYCESKSPPKVSSACSRQTEGRTAHFQSFLLQQTKITTETKSLGSNSNYVN